MPTPRYNLIYIMYVYDANATAAAAVFDEIIVKNDLFQIKHRQ